MSDERISYFPEDADTVLINDTEELCKLVSQLNSWVGDWAEQRRGNPITEIVESDQMTILNLTQDAFSFFESARVPVACAIYGPSQVGKSLLVGRVLEPREPGLVTLGRDEAYTEPELSFENDLNPSHGESEATALVTRFTTSDRIEPGPDPNCPVKVRALNRSQWLRVLGRGFQIECTRGKQIWDKLALEQKLSELSKQPEYSAATSDREWRSDLLQTYAYLLKNEKSFVASETEFNNILADYALSDNGYIQFAAEVFWNGWPELTDLYRRVSGFLQDIYVVPDASTDASSIVNSSTAIMTEWPGVRFLLDSSQEESPKNATCAWSDFRLTRRTEADPYVLKRQSDGKSYDLATIQAAMLEMVVPVFPDRLKVYWKRVLKRMDVLDIPGMRAGAGAGPEEGRRKSAKEPRAQAEIVKRGKVAFLFERYTQDRLIQTLVLLARGGNVEVTGYMKAHVHSWGRSRYEDRWPTRVNDNPPALLIGMTGIDTEFVNFDHPAPTLYEHRLETMRDALDPAMEHFGGGSFRNVFPLRYPGTWDANEESRNHLGAEKWDEARKIYLATEFVQQHVLSPEERWDVAMKDDDGGVSLISDSIFRCTSSEGKRTQLRNSIVRARQEVGSLAQSWYRNTDSQIDRAKRAGHAVHFLAWLYSAPEQIYYRIRAVSESLTISETACYRLANLADWHSKEAVPDGRSLEQRLEERLNDLLNNWSNKLAPECWKKYMQAQREHDGESFAEHYAPQIFSDTDFEKLVIYLRDYLKLERLFRKLVDKLQPIVQLSMHDEAALLQARRRCVRLVLNDFVMNPGPSIGRLPPVEGVELPEDNQTGFGLMLEVLQRWRHRLPEALASGAGADEKTPPGNEQLGRILVDFGADVAQS